MMPTKKKVENDDLFVYTAGGSRKTHSKNSTLKGKRKPRTPKT